MLIISQQPVNLKLISEHFHPLVHLSLLLTWMFAALSSPDSLKAFSQKAFYKKRHITLQYIKAVMTIESKSIENVIFL